MTLRSADRASSASEHSAVRKPWSKMTIRSDVLAIFQERDSKERYRR